jgi:tetratricopeptide (TPR) repeat protein
MTPRLHPIVLLAVLPLAFASTGCGQLRAKVAYKDGTKHYKSEEFKKAIEEYEHAIELDPSMAEAHFYLASSHQALYRPGKDSPENAAHLEKAIDHYKKSLEVNTGSSERAKTLRRNTLGFLSAIYSDDPYKSFEPAHDYAQRLVNEDPKDVKSQFLLAGLYEKFGRTAEAEAIYRKVADENPNDAKACGALAAFYNKPLWEGRAKFDDAVQIIEKCAGLNPSDETGYYKLATFYWDKAFRDPELSAEQKDQYANKGIEAIDKALKLKSDYVEGLVYKNLLLRVKASVATNPRLAQQYLDQANMLRDQATELKKQALQAGKTEAASGAAGGGEAAAGAAGH